MTIVTAPGLPGSLAFRLPVFVSNQGDTIVAVKMTREQIIGSIIINFLVGVFLLVMGAVLRSPLKRMWERMNRPAPLTPQTRGQLVTNLATYAASLERLNYLSTHLKDLFLYLIQLVMAALLFSIMAFFLYAFKLAIRDAPPVELSYVLVLVMLVFAGLCCGLGLWEAGRMSDKKIDATKESIQKRIDETNKQLNP
jgi:uncharacterized membrane protein YbhN (UPF0104 family)